MFAKVDQNRRYILYRMRYDISGWYWRENDLM